VIKILRLASQNIGEPSMTEFEKADANKNGAIEKTEWALLELEDRRRRIDDEDLKRNAERSFTGFALAGMLIYPFIILLASVLGFDKAASLITDIASVYVIAASGVVAAFMGFNAYSAKADKQASISYQDRTMEK
jgi:pilus assembly protein TadC